MRDGEVIVLVYTKRWLTPYTPRSQWVVAKVKIQPGFRALGEGAGGRGTP